MNVNDLNQQLIQYIGQNLTAAYQGTQQSTRWDQVLAAAARFGANRPVGEIRRGEDLQSVPRNQRLKAVYFPYDAHGPVIRWGVQGSMSSVLGGKAHDYFWRAGDNVSGGKQGYIQIDSYGNLSF